MTNRTRGNLLFGENADSIRVHRSQNISNENTRHVPYQRESYSKFLLLSYKNYIIEVQRIPIVRLSVHRHIPRPLHSQANNLDRVWHQIFPDIVWSNFHIDKSSQFFCDGSHCESPKILYQEFRSPNTRSRMVGRGVFSMLQNCAGKMSRLAN